ncbi:MAG: hypothetical protein WCT77_11890, partial [Bacteroidota bacterium]
MLKGKIRIKQITIPIVTLVILLGSWELADAIFGFNKIILPTPTEIGKAFISNWIILLSNTGIT